MVEERVKMRRQDDLSTAQGIIISLGLSLTVLIVVILMIKLVRHFVRI